jgi:twitching motility protein PilT
MEDPIEFVHKDQLSFVNQREVGADTKNFASALKRALRQDPDVILVGEMRDYETIGIAITSAETGHLVFGTLHTSSAPQTIARIIDVFPSDAQPQVITQLASNLVGVVSQILLPTADGKGRAVAAEVMKANTAIKNLIRTNNVDGIYQAIQTGGKEGMVTMDTSILNLVREGRVSYETAVGHVRDELTRRQMEQFKGKAPQSGAPKPAGPMAQAASAPAAAAAVSAMSEAVKSAQEPAARTEEPVAAQPKRGISAAIPPWEQK